MPYNLLLLPLLGGFLFLHFAHPFRFRAQRLDGYRLLVESAIAGVALIALSRLIVLGFAQTPFGLPCAGIWFSFSPFAYSDTLAWSLLLGPLLTFPVNAVVNPEQARAREIRSSGNGFTRLLHAADRDDLLISVTLVNLKWYVGYVAESPSLNPQEIYFRLVPIFSGYRNRETLVTTRTTLYDDVLQAADFTDFIITLPIADVKIANLFDAALYEGYFAKSK